MSEPTVEELIATHRSCYFILPQENGERDGFIPALAIEGVKGYRMMSGNDHLSTPWRWGKTLAIANETCDAMNISIGITPKEAMKIVASTMP